MFRKLILGVSLLCVFPAAPALAQADTYAGRPIREIRLHGLVRTRESLVRDQISSQVGRPYDPALAELDREKLDRLAIFSRIRVEPEPAGEEVILNVELSETNRLVPFPAFSIVEENGVSAGAGIKGTNLLGRGISASLDVRLGGQQEAEFIFDSPWGLKDKTWFGGEIHARSRTNELDHFEEDAVEGLIKGGWQFGPSLRVGGMFEFLTVRANEQEATIGDGRTESSPGIGFVTSYDTRDLWSTPHRGWQNNFSFTRFGGFLGGAGDFTKTIVDIRRYQPIAPKHTLAVFSFSTFQTGEVGVDIPIYRDFHLGGTNSIRGWSDLTARNGKNQFINTVEYRYDLVRPRSFRVMGFNLYGGLQLAAFGDVGTVWNEGEFSRNFIGGGGFGLRVIMPFIQMIRLDFGIGESGAGIVPHIGIREKAFYHPRRVR